MVVDNGHFIAKDKKCVKYLKGHGVIVMPRA